jgi:hypothetical protein
LSPDDSNQHFTGWSTKASSRSKKSGKLEICANSELIFKRTSSIFRQTGAANFPHFARNFGMNLCKFDLLAMATDSCKKNSFGEDLQDLYKIVSAPFLAAIIASHSGRQRKM